MRLVTPSVQWRSAFVELAAEYAAAGEHRHALALHDYTAYLQKLEARGQRDNLPAGRVPGCEFWLESDGKILACGRLRLGLTPELEEEGGHIGYDVRPSMRRRGYGTALLRMMLVKAREQGIERVRITCDDDNLGSIQVIERNGGLIAGRSISKESGKLIRQYWISG